MQLSKINTSFELAEQFNIPHKLLLHQYWIYENNIVKNRSLVKATPVLFPNRNDNYLKEMSNECKLLLIAHFQKLNLVT